MNSKDIKSGDLKYMEKCDEIRELIDGFIHGGLESETQAAVERHLEECEECRNEYLSQKEIYELVRASADEDTERIVGGVMQSIRAGKRRAKTARLMRFGSVAAGLVLIFGAVKLAGLDGRLAEGLKWYGFDYAENGGGEEISKSDSNIEAQKEKSEPEYSEKNGTVCECEDIAMADDYEAYVKENGNADMNPEEIIKLAVPEYADLIVSYELMNADGLEKEPEFLCKAEIGNYTVYVCPGSESEGETGFASIRAVIVEK